MVESRRAFESKLKRSILESKASSLQKKLVHHLDPDHLLDLEEKLKEALQVERVLMKLASRMNVSPARLQSVIEDFVDLINLLQI